MLFKSLVMMAPLLLSATVYADNLQVINDGVAGLQKRLEMIARAEKQIDVEYFIYKEDQAGRLITQALLKKKQEIPSIRIRLLLDLMPLSTNIKKNIIAELIDGGIEVKVYNPTHLVPKFRKAQFRDHRKFLIIDEKEALTGSRNIADEYFDLSAKFNFRDRDIWLEGPKVAEIQTSFADYWKSDWALAAKRAKVPNAKANDFITENAHDRFLLSEISRIGKPILDDPRSRGTCEKVSFVTDAAGSQNAESRQVYPALLAHFHEMNDEDVLYAESPYFVIRDQSAVDQLENLREREKKSVLLTNSLASTDAFYIAANFYPRTSFYQNLSKSQMYIFKGELPEHIDLIKNEDGTHLAQNAVWGIHSKTFVFSNDSFAIGTFNLDPRSANLNAEDLVFCEGNQELTRFVKDDIESRLKQSSHLNPDGKLDNGQSVFDGVGVLKRLKFEAMKWPATWFSYLL